MGDGSVRRSSSVEDYVRVIYGLVERGEAVTNASLAGRLEVSPSSASGMVTKLSQLGLVTHVPYRGIELTADGRLLARSVLRRHRLIETYLVSELGYTWDEVHAEADALEHAVSDRLVERIAAKLGNPVRDPHGDPIPAADGSVEELAVRILDDLEPGAVGEIVRVWAVPDRARDQPGRTHRGGGAPAVRGTDGGEGRLASRRGHARHRQGDRPGVVGHPALTRTPSAPMWRSVRPAHPMWRSVRLTQPTPHWGAGDRSTARGSRPAGTRAGDGRHVMDLTAKGD
jgi:DtxR family Mn-dependent transcriptional regulator